MCVSFDREPSGLCDAWNIGLDQCALDDASAMYTSV